MELYLKIWKFKLGGRLFAKPADQDIFQYILLRFGNWRLGIYKSSQDIAEGRKLPRLEYRMFGRRNI